MFGIGFQEMLIILVVVLIFFGPKRLPDLAKSLGKGIAEFKKASEEVRKGIEDAVKEESVTETPKPPEDLSSYGKAPGSAPAPEGTAAHGSSAPAGGPDSASGTPSGDRPVEPASSVSSASAENAGQGTATGETPATPPRQG